MIKNIVLSASGSKIFIHCGFLKYLEKNKLLDKLENIIGCSGGAFIGFLITIGYNIDTIIEVFLNINYDKLKKIDSDSILNFFDNWGIDNSEGFKRVITIFLKTKLNTTNITFKELYDKTNINLVITASNLCKNTEVFFDYIKFPDMDVIQAILMSISIPILFTPKKYDEEIYVDGALLCSYPIEYIEINKLKYEETLGIVIIPHSYICVKEIKDEDKLDSCIINSDITIDSFQTYLLTLLHSGSTKQLKNIYKKYKDITILAFNNQNGLDFELTKETRLQLISEGEKYTKEFLDRKEQKVDK